MRKVELDEYLSKLKFDEVWPRLKTGRDEETLDIMQTGRHRFKDILASIPSSSRTIKILDIGTTPFTFFLKETYPHYEVATLDLTNLAEDECRERGIRFQVHNLAEPPAPFEDGYFDIVILTEVLEHLFAPPSEVLKDIYRIIMPGGRLIFSIPNLATLFKRIQLLLGASPLPPPDEQMKKGWVHGYGHPREYTMKECIPILEACGFIIVKKKYLHPSLQVAKRQTKRGILTYLLLTLPYHLACLLVPSFRATISIECRKPE